MVKRTAIYTFWEKNGILQAHHLFYVKGLLEIANEVLLVANGHLTEESQHILDDAGIKYLIRPNQGLDFAAWKAGLEHIGKNSILSRDELILCNCSCYGPLFPFSESFKKMSDSDCDFWGINRQPERADGKWPHAHIQSYFYVFRKKVLESEAFWKWWEELKSATHYKQEIYTHEVNFTAYLESYGLTSAILMDEEKYLRMSPKGDAFKFFAHTQVIEDRSPLVKRKHMLGADAESWKTLLFIESFTNYPVQAICEDMARCMDTSPGLTLKNRILSLILVGKKRSRYRTKWEKIQAAKLWLSEGVTLPLVSKLPWLSRFR